MGGSGPDYHRPRALVGGVPREAAHCSSDEKEMSFKPHKCAPQATHFNDVPGFGKESGKRKAVVQCTQARGGANWPLSANNLNTYMV